MYQDGHSLLDAHFIANDAVLVRELREAASGGRHGVLAGPEVPTKPAAQEPHVLAATEHERRFRIKQFGAPEQFT